MTEGVFNTKSKYRKIFIILSLCFLIIELIVLIPDLLKVEADPADSRCIDNIKRIQAALDWYAREHNGKYPRKLDQLIPRYLGKVPRCPQAGTDLHYIKSYRVSDDLSSYRFNCNCMRHPVTGLHMNYPRYSSEKGLIVGP